jgi:hypothetical protein
MLSGVFGWCQASKNNYTKRSWQGGGAGGSLTVPSPLYRNQKRLSIPSGSALASGMPVTPELLRLDPMFDPLRNDPRFDKLVTDLAPKPSKR